MCVYIYIYMCIYVYPWRIRALSSQRAHGGFCFACDNGKRRQAVVASRLLSSPPCPKRKVTPQIVPLSNTTPHYILHCTSNVETPIWVWLQCPHQPSAKTLRHSEPGLIEMRKGAATLCSVRWEVLIFRVHMARFQLGSFLIWLVSNWAPFELPSFLIVCRIMASGKTKPGWPRWRRIRNEPCVDGDHTNHPHPHRTCIKVYYMCSCVYL